MPPAVHPDHHPHDTHGGNAIHDNDLDIIDDIIDEHHEQHPDVALSDLLDAYLDRDYYPGGGPEYHDLYQRASTPVVHAHWRVLDAVEAAREHRTLVARLSPEERAEFDRRTT